MYMMNRYVDKIKDPTANGIEIKNGRDSSSKLPVVLMSLEPDSVISVGCEMHPDMDQFMRFEQGKGMVVIDGVTHTVEEGAAIIVPAGTHHNIICSGHEALKLYTVFYFPPNYESQLI